MSLVLHCVNVLVILLSLQACESDPPPPKPPGVSVRVLTHNLALYSPAMMCIGNDPSEWTFAAETLQMFCYLEVGAGIQARAERIVHLIEPEKYDVIVFNEVFDENDGKDTLLDGLRGAYPHYVKYVDAEGGAVPIGGIIKDIREDSGLMLFSKFPFESLPSAVFKSGDSKSSEGSDSELLAFTDFERCHSDDCFANKGALLARLRHTSSEHIINVVATHLQADVSAFDDRHGWPLEPGTRALALGQILSRCEPLTPSPPGSTLVPVTLGPGLQPPESFCNWSNSQWLLLMGDLNIDGFRALGSAIVPGTAPNAGGNEWSNSIDVVSRNSKYPLYDAWAETTSVLDEGVTSGLTKRLDYILASRRTMPGTSTREPSDLCVQHIWIPPELEALSDHRAVAADLNGLAPQCNPRRAVTLSEEDLGEFGVSDGKKAKIQNGSIVLPGGMQWFRLREGGTYTVALIPGTVSGLNFEIYTGDNLSRPLTNSYELGTDTILACADERECSEVEGTKFVLPSGPLYIRIFAKERGPTGGYSLAVHKYSCKSMEEACELRPNTPDRFEFKPGLVVGEHDQAWFHLDVRDQADSGEPQTLHFVTRNLIDEEHQELTLYESDGETEVEFIDSNPVDQTTEYLNGKPTVRKISQTRNNVDLYMVVKRPDQDKRMRLRVAWQTNLTLLGGQTVGPIKSQVLCHDETNPEGGSDEIRLRVRIDGGSWQDRGDSDFDCNNTPDPEPWDSRLGVIRYLDNVEFELVEMDDAAVDSHSNALTPAPRWNMDVEMGAADRRGQLNWKWNGGEYEFQFSRGKRVE